MKDKPETYKKPYIIIFDRIFLTRKELQYEYLCVHECLLYT